MPISPRNTMIAAAEANAVPTTRTRGRWTGAAGGRDWVTAMSGLLDGLGRIEERLGGTDDGELAEVAGGRRGRTGPFEALAGAPGVGADAGAPGGGDQGADGQEGAEGEQGAADDGQDPEEVVGVGQAVPRVGEAEQDQREPGEDTAAEQDEDVEQAEAVGGLAAGHLGRPVHDPGDPRGEGGGDDQGVLPGGER